MKTLSEMMEEKANLMLAQPVTLRCRKTATPKLDIPVSVTHIFSLTFTIAELRAFGVKVTILTPDGREMSDDEIASAILHSETQ